MFKIENVNGISVAVILDTKSNEVRNNGEGGRDKFLKNILISHKIL